VDGVKSSSSSLVFMANDILSEQDDSVTNKLSEKENP